MRRLGPLGEFDRAVRRVVRAIPKGQVSSYGEVARRAGRPGGARQVASALRRLRDVPWWRVIQAGGTLAPKIAAQQGRRLRAEGLTVHGRKVLEAARLRGDGFAGMFAAPGP